MVTVIAVGPARIPGTGLFFRVHGFPSCSDSYFALFSHTFVDTFGKGELTFVTTLSDWLTQASEWPWTRRLRGRGSLILHVQLSLLRWHSHTNGTVPVVFRQLITWWSCARSFGVRTHCVTRGGWFRCGVFLLGYRRGGERQTDRQTVGGGGGGGGGGWERARDRQTDR